MQQNANRILLHPLFHKLKNFIEHIYKDYKIRIKNVFRYIEENYADSALSLRDMSDYLGINYSLLSRRIKEQTGVPFIEHLNKHRLRHASLLLGVKVTRSCRTE